jgi:hypothetical protein
MEAKISEAKQRILDTMAELGLTVESDFIPFSKSRNKGEKQPSLNWRVRLMRKGKLGIETEYGAGCAHCPSYKQRIGKPSYDEKRAIDFECETGKAARLMASMDHIIGGKPIPPDPADVIHSLVLDGSAIDAGSFESWASDYGYDIDSRKAEAMYRACVDTGLKLRAALGEDGLSKLREAFQDY